ncbi:thiolase family protein [Nocardioides sp. KR10-350]|uniref:thiolase family protein n=1 Tax=Nocardioides cheoyonin TaxID=3156615 RepID=UPI0032B5EF48
MTTTTSKPSATAAPLDLGRQVAVVGVGDTDYPVDWQLAREGRPTSDGYGHAVRAFTRALTDAGLTKRDVDGLVVGPTLAYERTAEVLGLNLRWAAQADAAGAVAQGMTAIVTGQAECVALVYGNDQRLKGVQYGGPAAMGGDAYLSYVYYQPWGLTSQGALYALLARRYMAKSGLTEKGLGEVAVGQRMFARLNPRAVMRKDLRLDDYLNARLIADPLRLFDYTIINDGGVALILLPVERAQRLLGDRAVPIRAIARCDLNLEATSLRPRLLDFYHPAHHQTAHDLYEAAACGPADVDALQVYDSFTVHIPLALTGFGFTTDDEIGDLLESGATKPGGRIPVNTSGGHLSESYMQGWNHQVEAVRQVRGEAGARQLDRHRLIQYVSDVAGKVTSLIYEAPASRHTRP